MSRGIDKADKMIGKLGKAFLGIAFVGFLLWLVLGLIPLLGSMQGLTLGTEDGMHAYAQERAAITAPELNGGLGWLNVDQPLRLKDDLRGKIVLLDFWTYCCINCMHVIPDLKELEKKYPDELVVIGVHSAKFHTEKETAHIRAAVLRHEIEHPVVNDAEFAIWNAYTVQAWPTLVLIDPNGKIVGAVSGEGHFNTLDREIGNLVQKFEGKLNREPLPLALEKDKEAMPVLAFPGKVLADAASNRLFISDTNHNRIVISDLQGKVIDVVGTGVADRVDGGYGDAAFDHPQGMALAGDLLYVADTENHVLRRIDLSQKRVETVAGTGEQTFIYKGGPALQTGLNSPWDAVMLDGKLYICNAGQHQLWVYDPGQETVAPFAGSSRENIVDGSLRAAQLAQPSGITTDGTHLYFADSEVSAVRMVVMDRVNPQVQTLVGKGLFVFGDKDGPYLQALLQHPLGVAYREGVVYVADAYNHKIKRLDLRDKQVTTFLGDGKPGFGTAEAPQFYEPSGLSFAGEVMYIADTNNHAIRRVDLKTSRVDTLVLDFMDYERRKSVATFAIPTRAKRLNLNELIPSQGTVRIQFELGEGFHLNPLAKATAQYRLTAPDGAQWISPVLALETTEDELEVGLNSNAQASAHRIELVVTYYYCREDGQGACYMDTLVVEGSMRTGEGTVRAVSSG